MSSQYYYKQEAKKGFRDWTIAGLEFVLRAENILCTSIRKIANKKLQELKGEQ